MMHLKNKVCSLTRYTKSEKSSSEVLSSNATVDNKIVKLVNLKWKTWKNKLENMKKRPCNLTTSFIRWNSKWLVFRMSLMLSRVLPAPSCLVRSHVWMSVQNPNHLKLDHKTSLLMAGKLMPHKTLMIKLKMKISAKCAKISMMRLMVKQRQSLSRHNLRITIWWPRCKSKWKRCD